MMNYSPSALDLGLGQGDILRRQQEETEEERRKKLLQLSNPSKAMFGAGMGQAASDLIGFARG